MLVFSSCHTSLRFIPSTWFSNNQLTDFSKSTVRWVTIIWRCRRFTKCFSASCLVLSLSVSPNYAKQPFSLQYRFRCSNSGYEGICSLSRLCRSHCRKDISRINGCRWPKRSPAVASSRRLSEHLPIALNRNPKRGWWNVMKSKRDENSPHFTFSIYVNKKSPIFTEWRQPRHRYSMAAPRKCLFCSVDNPTNLSGGSDAYFFH